jgi:partner of Y14 and mago
MSKPPLFPEQSASGIAVDPRTLDRVVPESRRADGSYATYHIFT